MFSYFGSKSKIVHLYRKPQYPLIIEPFAGSARYAVRYYSRDVWINDADPIIYEIWKWIINATKSDIRALPVLKHHENISDHKWLSDAERWLLGFTVGPASASPHAAATRWGANDTVPRLQSVLLKYCGKLSHWRLTNLHYSKMRNVAATWYVDPPYQIQGVHYRYSTKDIDFQHLGLWCRERGTSYCM